MAKVALVMLKMVTAPISSRPGLSYAEQQVCSPSGERAGRVIPAALGGLDPVFILRRKCDEPVGSGA